MLFEPYWRIGEMTPFFQSDGTTPHSMVRLNMAAIGPATFPASSRRRRLWIPSGPEDLYGFRDRSLFCTISSGMINSWTVDEVLGGSWGTSSCDSNVNTLKNCLCNRSALDLSSNLSEVVSSRLSSRGAMPVFVFSFDRAWDQNFFLLPWRYLSRTIS